MERERSARLHGASACNCAHFTRCFELAWSASTACITSARHEISVARREIAEIRVRPVRLLWCPYNRCSNTE